MLLLFFNLSAPSNYYQSKILQIRIPQTKQIITYSPQIFYLSIFFLFGLFYSSLFFSLQIQLSFVFFLFLCQFFSYLCFIQQSFSVLFSSPWVQYIMLEQYLNKPSFSQAQLYTILTQFIEVFKKFIKISDQIITSFNKQLPYPQQINTLNKLLLQFQKIIRIGNFDLNQTSHQNHTYFRFAKKLLEIISVIHKKCTEPIYSFYYTFLQRMQNCISSFKLKLNLANFFKNCFNLSAKFYKGCNLIMKHESVQSALLILDTPCEQRQLNEAKFNKKQIQIDKKVQNSSIGRDINFSLINWLDIDCNYLNSMIFLANNQKEELVRLMYERNKCISKFIANYSKEFQYYLKRRERLQQRKNRFKQLKKLNYNTVTTNFKLQDKISKTLQPFSAPNRDQSIGSTRALKKRILIYEDKSETKSKKQFSQQKNQNSHLSMRFHPIKNVFLTFNNHDTHKTPKNAYYRNLQDTNKGYSILKESKYGYKHAKYQQKGLQNSKTTIQMNKTTLQMNRFSISNASGEKRSQRFTDLHSLTRHLSNNTNQQFQKRQMIEKSRNIRNIRKSELSKTFKHFNLIFQHQKSIKTEMDQHLIQKIKAK